MAESLITRTITSDCISTSVPKSSTITVDIPPNVTPFTPTLLLISSYNTDAWRYTGVIYSAYMNEIVVPLDTVGLNIEWNGKTAINITNTNAYYDALINIKFV